MGNELYIRKYSTYYFPNLHIMVGVELVKAQRKTTGYITFLSKNLIQTYIFSNHIIIGNAETKYIYLLMCCHFKVKEVMFFATRSGETINLKIGSCYYSTKHLGVRTKPDRHQLRWNVSEYGDMHSWYCNLVN